MIIILPKSLQDKIDKKGRFYIILIMMGVGVGYFGYGFGLVESGNDRGFMWAICGCMAAMAAAVMIRLQRNKDSKCVKS
jgi:hypothetical protein